MNTSNLLRRTSFWFVDFPKRLSSLTTRKLGINSVFTNSDAVSDSDSTPYTAIVEKALGDQKTYANFRRDYHYRVILEHVDFILGNKYLKELSDENRMKLIESDRIRSLNKPGNPRLFKFKELGLYSPTSIRYMHVAQQIENLFGQNFGKNIVEIGIGFGGQYVILSEKFKFNSYTFFDLDPVIALTQKVLIGSGNRKNNVRVGNVLDPNIDDCDLVISNYAFSELPSNIQMSYINGVIGKAARGFLIMNSGRTNNSGRSKGKLNLEDLTRLLPPFEVIEEFPKTGSDNYIIVWGHR
jgi:hypothetical protein